MANQTIDDFKRDLNTNIQKTATQIYDSMLDMINSLPKSSKGLSEKVNIIWQINRANVISASILIIMSPLKAHDNDPLSAVLLVNGWYNQTSRFTPSDMMDNVIYVDKYTVKPDIKACVRITKKVYKLMLSVYNNTPQAFSGVSVNT